MFPGADFRQETVLLFNYMTNNIVTLCIRIKALLF